MTYKHNIQTILCSNQEQSSKKKKTNALSKTIRNKIKKKKNMEGHFVLSTF